MRTLLILALTLVVIVFSAASSQAQPGTRQVVRIDFDRLHPSGDLRLTGRSVRRTLALELGRPWKPVGGSALHLIVSHSPDLDSDRSFLSISVNYGIIRSIRLHQSNASPTEVVVPIPPELLKRDNELQFVVEQHANGSAPPDAMWTTIDRRSFVEIQGEHRQPRMDLAELPDSFVDGAEGGQLGLSVLVPKQPSAATLEGTARVIASLAKEVLPGSLDVRVTRSLRGGLPLLVVGTAEEQPQIDRLRPPGLVFRSQDGRQIAARATGEPLGPHEGVVGLVDADTRVLFVTGNSADAVHRAATATLRTKTLAGPMATVETEADTSPQAARWWKGYIPPASSFVLGDLARGNLRIPAHQERPLIVPLNVTPDTRFLAYGHRINLRLSINAAYFTPQAKLRVEWNDVPLAEYQVTDALKGTVGSLPVWVARELLKPQNVLQLRWLDPVADDTGAAAAWVLSDTEFYIPRFYQAALPDLALLQSRFYPFSLNPDLHDVVIVLPDRISDAVFEGLLELSAALGAMAPADRVAFRVKRSGDVTERDTANSHLIVLHADESPVALLSSLAERRPLLWKTAPRRDPLIQELRSPWNADVYVLALTARSDAGLQQLVATAFSERTLSTLRGDAAYLTARGLVSQTVTTPTTIGGYPYFTASEAWLRAHWAALPAIVTFASGLFFAACRLALRYRV
jgi:hypothetical protein